MAKVPAKPSSALPKGTTFTGTASKLAVGPHVAAYAAKLGTAQRAVFYGLPASQQAASAGCATYSTQYAYRQYLRTSGARAAGHWGGNGGGPAPQAQRAAKATAKLVQAGKAGAATAKRTAQQASKADATAQAS